MQRPPRLRITEISPHLICALCGGYLIDATTIVECLHSFCKTCIVRYLESSKYCPICEVLVHKTRPLQNIRLDNTLQDIVYKLIPGLFKEEMRRRRDYYKNSPTIRSKHRSGTPHSQTSQRVIYTADELFSISLELCPDGRVRQGSSGKRKLKTEGSDKRYLLCPAGTSIAHLKKFIQQKFGLAESYKVDIFHRQGNIRDSYSMMDVAYIYSWRREGVLEMFYSVYKEPEVIPKIEIAKSTSNETSGAMTTLEDVKPTPTLASTSLLSSHCCEGNLPHDLSPLELIATVANDLSCLEEGRGLKRKAEAAELCYENEEDSPSEIQIKKSIEHAIDLCSNGNASNENSDTGAVIRTDKRQTVTSASKANSSLSSTTASDVKRPTHGGSGNPKQTAKSSESISESSSSNVNHSRPAGKYQKLTPEVVCNSNHVDTGTGKTDRKDTVVDGSTCSSNNNNNNSSAANTTETSQALTAKGKLDIPREAQSSNQKAECLVPVSQINGFCKQPETASVSPIKGNKAGNS